jgi:hypothetical protein
LTPDRARPTVAACLVPLAAARRRPRLTAFDLARPRGSGPADLSTTEGNQPGFAGSIYMQAPVDRLQRQACIPVNAGLIVSLSMQAAGTLE